MENLLAQIEQYKKEIKEAVVSNKEQLEAFRIKYLGSKGLLKTIMGEMKTVAAEQKREAGQLLNEFKLATEAAFEAFQNSIVMAPQKLRLKELMFLFPAIRCRWEAAIR